ncbi:MAG: protein BatD [Methylotenera sp.]|nr:protein BatD [Oligoflexia bacterium]
MKPVIRSLLWTASILILSTSSVVAAAFSAVSGLPYLIHEAHADDEVDSVQFTAKIDRKEITLDDSVSVKFSIQSDGKLTIGKPRYSAPGFELVNEYSGTYVESYYVNGRFGVKHNQEYTYILRPVKTGTFTIGDLEVRVGSRTLKAPPITVFVRSGGAATPPPKNYGGGGAGLRGSGKRVSNLPFFVRAEMDQQKIYKGQQVIVSYYLYQRARTFNLQVDKYPVLTGFLREDLEMPILQGRLDSEAVVLDGVAYQRALMVRYAAYPLKEGKLTIDSMSVKANYYAPRQGLGDDEDPFTQFFQQMAPQASNSQSDPLILEVLPLPTDGRPADFSGGVGDYNLTASVDKSEVRANEPVSFLVKLEGKGNLATIEEPKLNLPANVELYESKGQTKNGQGGIGEKIFELLLIPRAQGQVTLPSVEMSFFDPLQAKYVKKSTSPILLNVLEGAPGSNVALPPKKEGSPSAVPGANVPMQLTGIRPLKSESVVSSSDRGMDPNLWAALFWAGIAASLCAFATLVFRMLKGRKPREQLDTGVGKIRKNAKEWAKLKQTTQLARQGLAFKDVIESYDRLSDLVYDALDAVYPQESIRSLSRIELHEVLVLQKNLSEAVWQRTCRLFEFTEAVRFASSAGAVSEQVARGDLEKWVNEGQLLENEFLNRYK